jgi:hypothetical protein
VQCPLYPQKQTLELGRAMSALCQKRTSSSPAIYRWKLLTPLWTVWAPRRAACNAAAREEENQ